MKRYILITQLLTGVVFLFFIVFYFGNGYDGKEKTLAEQTETLAKEPISSYSVTKINADNLTPSQIVYNPMNNTLVSITNKKNRYSLAIWQSETHWTTGVASWKIKKNQKLDNFTYNTNGALYACLKEYKKNVLQKQTLVRLRGNGKIQKVNLSMLNNLGNTKSTKAIPEISDIQCSGTSISITYQYGAMKIYNLSEGQALGAESITGTPSHNVFYDLHYFTVKRESKKKSVLLYDYDIRTGEIAHSFPLGGDGQDTSLFHLSNYQDTLYLLTPKGIFLGNCKETKLVKYLDYRDLHIPSHCHITFMQAARDKTIYLGYQSSDQQFFLQQLTLPNQPQTEQDKTEQQKI